MLIIVLHLNEVPAAANKLAGKACDICIRGVAQVNDAGLGLDGLALGAPTGLYVADFPRQRVQEYAGALPTLPGVASISSHNPRQLRIRRRGNPRNIHEVHREDPPSWLNVLRVRRTPNCRLAFTGEISA